jgi:hypothetical protein
MSSTYRLSLLANIVLGAIVAVMLWRSQLAPSTPAVAPTLPAVARPIAPTPAAAAPEPQPAATPAQPTSALAQFEQLGVSRDTVVNVLVEDINRRSQQRIVELQKKYAPKSVPEAELRAVARQSTVEQREELKAALGEEGYLAWDKEQALHALNRARPPGDEIAMTPAEAEQAYRLQKAFDEEYQGLQEAMEDGFADRADASQLQAQAQQTLDRELEKLLGAQRFNELRGKSDSTTEVYRRYGDLNPTPDQAKAVAQVEAERRAREAALAQRLNENPGSAGNVAAELKALSDAQDENLRRIFGAEAYDAMKRQNDPTYKTLRQYADAWALQDQEIQSVYETLHAFNDQAERTRSAAELRQAAGQAVNWREINAAIEQARQQTEAGLQNLIGAERLRRLKQNGLLTAR